MVYRNEITKSRLNFAKYVSLNPFAVYNVLRNCMTSMAHTDIEVRPTVNCIMAEHGHATNIVNKQDSIND